MSTTDTASEKISISTKDLSAEDRKMLRGIFFHSFNVFAHYGGGALWSRFRLHVVHLACHRAFLPG